MEIKANLFSKQKEAMKLLQDISWQGEVMYGGGARGGKSFLSSSWLVSSSFRFPRSQWLIGFKELKHLRRTTLPDMINIIRMYTEPLNGAKWRDTFRLNQMDMVIEFINGSKIYLAELASLPSDPNFDRLGSLSLTGFAVDEAQRVSKKAIDTLQARLSLTQGNGWETAPKALYTCNPKKNWIYTEFWRPLIKEGQKIENKRFITSLYSDNPYINHEQYKKQVLNSGNKVQIERLLYGNFEYEDGDNVLMNYDKIIDIFSNHAEKSDHKYIIADIARFGKDKTTIYVWQGLNAIERIEIAKSGLDVIVNRIEKLREKYNISKSNVLIDEDGIGGGVVDFGKYKGFVANSRPVQINQAKYEKDEFKKQSSNYKNLKTQCVYKLAELVNAGKIQLSFSCEKDTQDKIIQDLESYKADKIDQDTALCIIAKDKQKELLGRSPDDGDALLMRAYFELRPPINLSFLSV